MKQRLYISATLLLAVAIPQSVKAYSFSADAPTGQTLYYNIITGANRVTVTSPNFYIAFNDCLEHNIEEGNNRSIDYFHCYISAGNEAWSGYSKPTGDLTIPSSVTYNGITYSVTGIDKLAFCGCDNLTSVTIGDSITSIGDLAFLYCTNIISVHFNADSCELTGEIYEDYNDDCNTLYINYRPIFVGCTNITTFTFGNNVKIIPSYLCFGLSGLTSVTIPNSVRFIGDSAFCDCSSLTSVAFNADSCTSAGGTANKRAFIGCTNITTFTFGNNVKIIPPYLCHSLSGLESVTIPNSVKSIGRYAFFGCSGISSLTIGDSVTTIGNRAFRSCSGLTEINCSCSIAPSLDEYAFSGVTNTIPVNIPCGSTASYLSRWSHFSNFNEPAPLYTINVQSTDEIIGNASIMTAPDCNNIAIIEATADYGYHFTQWNDGNTDNPRTITLTQDTSFTAHFANNQYTVNVVPSHADRGNVTGGGTVNYLDNVTVTATANYGYHFDHWSDGNTDNPYTIAVIQDLTLTAYFVPNQYSLEVVSSDETRGHVSGGGNYDYLSNRTITATADYGYHFTQWNDGNTDNPRTITLTQDTSFVANYALNQYTLTVESNNESIGTVDGGGTYNYHDTIVITATPIDHHHLVCWSGGNRDNPRLVVIVCDTVFTATFAIDTHTVSAAANEITRGVISGSGEYAYGTACILTAIPYEGYTFAGWSNGVLSNPYAFPVVTDVELTALFVEEGEEVYTVTVVSADPTMGSVSGGGQAMSGGEVTIHAAGNPGYHFLCWNDNSTDSVRTVTVAANATYTAYFEANNVGMDDVNAIGAKVYSSRGQIVVEGANGNMVTLFDVTGRVLVTKQDEYSLLHFDAPASGTYMIKIGNYPARKIVVIR